MYIKFEKFHVNPPPIQFFSPINEEDFVLRRKNEPPKSFLSQCHFFLSIALFFSSSKPLQTCKQNIRSLVPFMN